MRDATVVEITIVIGCLLTHVIRDVGEVLDIFKYGIVIFILVSDLLPLVCSFRVDSLLEHLLQPQKLVLVVIVRIFYKVKVKVS